MISKSIRWQLQIWYGLILVVVLVGFGVTAFQLERGRVMRGIDGELLQRNNALGGVLRQQFRGRPEDGPIGRPQRGEFRPQREFDRNRRPPEGSDMPENPPQEFRIPLPVLNMFDENGSNVFYYIVRARDGRELARSTNAPAELEGVWEGVPAFRANSIAPGPGGPRGPRFDEESPNAPGNRMQMRPREPLIQTRGNYREALLVTPPGEKILVGRSIAPEMKEIRLVALTLTAVGAGILLLGLAGGWWIASRAIRPIKEISATAAKISSGDLSQRISTGETESELGQLASVLNSTFARLEGAFRQQQQFTSDAAHELRTPVSVMLTQAQSTLNRDRSAAEYREAVEACQRAAQRMRRLIESLLELARFDAGQEQLKRLQFDFSRTVGDCVELVKPLADERGVKIHSELAPVNCVGDSERLSQVVTNLLTNAIQYNKAEGEVRVKLQSENGVAVLNVADTGAGISAEDLPRVFERFYRADKSRSTGGNGLGLAISKAIVEAHGGTLDVESQPGTGSTFTLRLPTG
jgi:two-component system OmpR family sensor kinase